MKTIRRSSIALIFTICVGSLAQAKVWRINNNTSVSNHFTSLTAAFGSGAVLNGDTLYVEGSATAYDGGTLSKRLVIIGTGYFLSGTGANSGLQANPNTATISNISFDSLSSGSTCIGVSITAYLNSNVDNITFTRCNVSIQQNTNVANSFAISNLAVNKCKAYIYIPAFKLENPQVTNCIFASSVAQMTNVVNGLFRNNTLISPILTLNNCYVTNNIISGGNVALSNCTVTYNVSTANNLPDPVINNNKVNVAAASLFVGGASADGQYQLSASSPALAAGEPINGVTPDAGAFGTADPYRLSGIPPIPTIYSLTVPTSVPASATSMTITFSTRSNN
jgi:hypothetical protein